MDINITTERMADEAEELRSDIQESVFGYERRFLEFVMEYSSDMSRVEEAVLLAQSIKSAEVIEDHQGQEFKREVINILNMVLSEYSREDYLKQEEVNKKAHEKVVTDYLSRTKIVFRCKGLSVSFPTKGGRDGFKLEPIDLALRKGQITGVVGENGNGKTTLFRLIVGELKPSEGSMSYSSLQRDSRKGLSRNSIRSKVAYVPQEIPAWHGRLIHHLEYEAAIHGIRGDTNSHRVNFIIERLQLGGHLSKRWKHLSGGYRFRFALAKALVWNPDLMVLDEPLANLDVNALTIVLSDLRAIASSVSNPISIILSSQHIHELESIADNLVFLRDGQAIFNGRASSLGAELDRNIFEVGTTASQQDIRRAIGRGAQAEIFSDGIHYTVHTVKSFSSGQLLHSFLSNHLDVNYFRDISSSTKALFKRVA